MAHDEEIRTIAAAMVQRLGDAWTLTCGHEHAWDGPYYFSSCTDGRVLRFPIPRRLFWDPRRGSGWRVAFFWLLFWARQEK